MPGVSKMAGRGMDTKAFGSEEFDLPLNNTYDSSHACLDDCNTTKRRKELFEDNCASSKRLRELMDMCLDDLVFLLEEFRKLEVMVTPEAFSVPGVEPKAKLYRLRLFIQHVSNTVDRLKSAQDGQDPLDMHQLSLLEKHITADILPVKNRLLERIKVSGLPSPPRAETSPTTSPAINSVSTSEGGLDTDECSIDDNESSRGWNSDLNLMGVEEAVAKESVSQKEVLSGMGHDDRYHGGKVCEAAVGMDEEEDKVKEEDNLHKEDYCIGLDIENEDFHDSIHLMNFDYDERSGGMGDSSGDDDFIRQDDEDDLFHGNERREELEILNQLETQGIFGLDDGHSHQGLHMLSTLLLPPSSPTLDKGEKLQKGRQEATLPLPEHASTSSDNLQPGSTLSLTQRSSKSCRVGQGNLSIPVQLSLQVKPELIKHPPPPPRTQALVMAEPIIVVTPMLESPKSVSTVSLPTATGEGSEFATRVEGVIYHASNPGLAPVSPSKSFCKDTAPSTGGLTSSPATQVPASTLSSMSVTREAVVSTGVSTGNVMHFPSMAVQAAVAKEVTEDINNKASAPSSPARTPYRDSKRNPNPTSTAPLYPNPNPSTVTTILNGKELPEATESNRCPSPHPPDAARNMSRSELLLRPGPKTVVPTSVLVDTCITSTQSHPGTSHQTSGVLVESSRSMTAMRPMKRRRSSLSYPSTALSQAREVRYQCSACAEGYLSTAVGNPWWRLTRQQCPKCRTIQIPRVDIFNPTNNVEGHLSVLADACMEVRRECIIVDG
ncbi:unnamed protein product, partial [Choristocarpus tenellus]